MRVEVHSPDGLESAYQGVLGNVDVDADGYVTLTTPDGYGVVLLTKGDAATLLARLTLAQAAS